MGIEDITKTDAAKEIVKKVTPSMAFPIILIVVVGGFVKILHASLYHTKSYMYMVWFWFIPSLFIMIFSIYGYYLDIRKNMKN